MEGHLTLFHCQIYGHFLYCGFQEKDLIQLRFQTIFYSCIFVRFVAEKNTVLRISGKRLDTAPLSDNFLFVYFRAVRG